MAVTIENQFGKQHLVLGLPRALLVPTLKQAIIDDPDGRPQFSEFPEKLDHYLIYNVLPRDKPLEREVALRDQFWHGEARVMFPRGFAVPVTKEHDGREYPIHNEEAHLVIYDLDPWRYFERPKTVRIANQFFEGYLKLFSCIGLAVPSRKLHVEGL